MVIDALMWIVDLIQENDNKARMEQNERLEKVVLPQYMYDELKRAIEDEATWGKMSSTIKQGPRKLRKGMEIHGVLVVSPEIDCISDIRNPMYIYSPIDLGEQIGDQMSRLRKINEGPLHVTLKHGEWRVDVLESKYQDNDRTALILVERRTQEQVVMASVNLPEESLKDDEILIKDWSENEGVLDFLLKNGIVEDTGTSVPTGQVSANLCKYLKREVTGG